MTYEFVSNRLDYDPETGFFTWKKCRDSGRIGKRPSSLDVSGYLQINICGTVCKGHRLAWMMVHKEMPKGHIDHINGIRNDNRIVNLRCVTGTMNTQNKRLGSCRNKCGYLGVYEDVRLPEKVRFRAKIQFGKKQLHLGGYPTPELAHEAYVLAKRKYHEGCTI